MGLKKYSEEEAKKLEEAEIEAQKAQAAEAPISSDDEILNTINENQKAEDELNALPLEESDDAVKNRMEAGRQAFFVEQKKIRRLNTIFSVLVLVIIAGAFVLMLTLGREAETQYVTYIGLGIMVLSLAGAFVLSKVTKNKLGQAADKYLKDLFKNIDEYLYSGDYFENLEVNASSQLKDELFIDARFYQNIKNTRSRNTVTVDYKGKKLISADLAGNIMVKNKLSPMFLGRFYDYENNYDKEGCRIIMQIKGGNLSRPVDDLDGIELVENNKTYLIYTNDKEWKKTLNSRVIGLITSLKIDKTLIDVIVSIRPGKTCIGIDYSDEAMAIPVDKEIDFSSIKRNQRDLKKVLSVLDEIR